MGLGDGLLEIEVGVFAAEMFSFLGERENGLACGVDELRFDRGGRGFGAPGVLQADMQLEGCIFVRAVERREDLEVADVQRRAGDERYVAEDAAHAPEVLVFHVAAVGPAIDFDRDGVLAGLEILGDVELGDHAGVLAVADLLAIDPDVVGGIDAVEEQVGLAAVPRGRKSKSRR